MPIRNSLSRNRLLLGNSAVAEPRDHFGSSAGRAGAGQSESAVTVLVAFGANLLVAIAKSAAAALTGSASMLAEAAHSWADTGNEVFLLVANRRSLRRPDLTHPLGYGREAYVWSLFAAIGLFVAGAAVSITHGIQELVHPHPASDFVVGYVVLAISFLLEGASSRGPGSKQARGRVDESWPHPSCHSHLGSDIARGVCGGLRRDVPPVLAGSWVAIGGLDQDESHG